MRQNLASHLTQERPSTPWLEHQRHNASPSTSTTSKALERQELSNMSRGWNDSLSCSFAFTCRLVWPIGGEGRQIPQLLPVFHIKHFCNQVGNDNSLINVARVLPATGWSDRQNTGEVPLSSHRSQELVCSWRRRTCKAKA